MRGGVLGKARRTEMIYTIYRLLVVRGGSKSMAGAVFSSFSVKMVVSMCPKCSNGSRLSAREAPKHCACARIRAYKVCRLFGGPGSALVCFLSPFGVPWEALGETLGTLWGTFGNFGSHGVLWDASGAPFWQTLSSVCGFRLES